MAPVGVVFLAVEEDAEGDVVVALAGQKDTGGAAAAADGGPWAGSKPANDIEIRMLQKTRTW